MKKYLLSLFALILTVGAFAQVTVLEDFENGSQIGWNATFGDGVFQVVENPLKQDTLADPLMINPSDSVGSYTKDSTAAFSLLISVLDDSLDLSTNNKFTIQVYSPVATSLLFKIEGDVSMGEFLERRTNIASGTTNRWVEYSFDMSAAANFTTVNKIILFFDPGNDMSGDTYFFDNITVGPADECAGTVPDPAIVDDFECQRNQTLGLNFASLEVIDNPDPSGINTSSTIGAFNDSDGGRFQAFVYDYGSTIDLSTNSILNMKVWAPFANRIVAKLEGGSSPATSDREFFIEDGQEMTWVNLMIDFSDQVGADHNRIVFFFNAFEDAGEEDIFFVDDILWTPVPPAEAIEDFEDGGKLTWAPLNDDTAIHGTFSIIANPDMMGNESANIGSYTKGSSQFSTVTTNLSNGLDLTENAQLDLQVWAPAGSSTITMQLVSLIQGTQEVTRDITATEEWTTVSFNFEDFSSVTDFFQLNILFDSGTASSDTYFFDNLTLGASTVDPCEGVEPIMNIIDDFDCQRNFPIIVGQNEITIIDNPDPSGINANPLNKVASYEDPFGEFDAIVYDFGAPIDLSVRNQLTLKIWSPEIVPLVFKLEGGSDPDFETAPIMVPEANTWVEYVVDFSSQEGTNNSRLTLFLNFNQVQAEQLTYFIDDISWQRSPYTACIADFETSDFQLNSWGFFPDAKEQPTLIANPNPSDLNMSDSVGYYLEEATGTQPWAGMFHPMEAPITLPNDNKTITMKVLGPVAGSIVMKLEGGVDNVPQTGDTPVDYTTPGEWQELTWDFNLSPNPTPDDAAYRTLTIIPNITEIPTENQEWYFDDIAIAGSICAGATTSIFAPIQVDQLSIAPNPVIDFLQVNNIENVDFFVIHNMVGQRFHMIQTTGQPAVNINLSDLNKGMYVLSAYDRSGALLGNAKFIKQ
ncbi:MAG: T9SS type A sorting domain-containing protein [Bacteroidota bacterium]